MRLQMAGGTLLATTSSRFEGRSPRRISVLFATPSRHQVAPVPCILEWRARHQTGDKSSLADTNWIATVAPVTHLGAEPVFSRHTARHGASDPALVERCDNRENQDVICGSPLRQPATWMGYCGWVKSTYQLSGMRPGLVDLSTTASVPAFHGCIRRFSFGTKTLTTGEGAVCHRRCRTLRAVADLIIMEDARANQAILADKIGYWFRMSNIPNGTGLHPKSRLIDELIRLQNGNLWLFIAPAKSGACVVERGTSGTSISA